MTLTSDQFAIAWCSLASSSQLHKLGGSRWQLSDANTDDHYNSCASQNCCAACALPKPRHGPSTSHLNPSQRSTVALNLRQYVGTGTGCRAARICEVRNNHIKLPVLWLTIISTLDISKAPTSMRCPKCPRLLMNPYKGGCCDTSICETCKSASVISVNISNGHRFRKCEQRLPSMLPYTVQY